MIKLIDVSKVVEKERYILRDISLEINKGDFITIIGKSGSGKTSLLQVIGLIDNFTSGSVIVENSNVKQLKEKEIEIIRRDNIGFVFQQHNLISTLSVFENIFIAYHKDLTYKQKEKEIDILLKKFNLYDKKNENIKILSGGEAQRVSIIRAIINKPKYLLCDEPTGALDSQNSENVINILLEIRKKYEIAILIVTHDMSIANKGIKKFVMKDGYLNELD